MDKLSGVSRLITAPSSLEQLPHEVLQQILHYLPVKTARSVFRLVNRNYLVSTDYLRSAGMVQTRIRNKIASESQQQAESRFASLISDCVNSAYPVALRSALVIELIGTLPQLPGASHAAVMQVVLAQCGAIGEHAGQAARQKCMAECIHAYQRRTELEPQLKKFRPANDEEARIAAGYFVADLERSGVSFKQGIERLENLLDAMDWIASMSSSDESSETLIIMCDYCTENFSRLDNPYATVAKAVRSERHQALRTKFVEKALLLLPAKSMVCQAALISVILDLSDEGSTIRKQAAKDGRNLIRKISDAGLAANMTRLATSLFYKGVINTLIERVGAWPEPRARVGLLRQLAVVAWKKRAMEVMEGLCARISKVEPPDPVALNALMQENMHISIAARVELATRDIIPYLLCVAPGLARAAAVKTLSRFMPMLPDFTHQPKQERRMMALSVYGMMAQVRLLHVAELKQLSDAPRLQGDQNFTGNVMTLLEDPRFLPISATVSRLLSKVEKPNSKPINPKAEDQD
jgi:hypothetical protein